MIAAFIGIATVVLICSTQLSEAAATSNGDLLKFHPISSDQYSSLVSLIQQQQPVVHEGRVLNDGHRTLAEWSDTLPGGWSELFDLSTLNEGTVQSADGNVKAYPLCVLKANATTIRRRKRGGRQYDYNFNYAGLAPNVVYNSVPQQQEYQQSVAFAPIPSEQGKSNDSPVVNCVMVIRRNSDLKATTTPKPQVHLPPGGYPYPPPFYGYPGYPPYGYPPPFPPPPPTGAQPAPPATFRHLDDRAAAVNPNAQLMYQTMLNQYYQQLGRLYSANSVAPVPRRIANTGNVRLQIKELGRLNSAASSAETTYDDTDYNDNYDDDEYDDDDEDDYNNNDAGQDNDIDEDGYDGADRK